jgi:hypothetical protein
MQRYVKFMICMLVMVAAVWAVKNPDTYISNLPTARTNNGVSKIGLPTVIDSRAILVIQLPDSINSYGYACQLDSVYPFFADIADDVTPPASGWMIDTVITYWNNWNGFTSWTNVPNIHIKVYYDSVGASPPMPKNVAFLDVVVPQANFSVVDLGNLHYVVKCRLTSPMVVPGGARLWFEVQPSNVFTVNGQTGWICQSGIGNGQELMFRFPLLGYPNWVTATSMWGEPLEAGMIIKGSIANDTVRWNFETGLQGWTHTNGYTFPNAWGVTNSNRHQASGYMCPNPQDSSLWFDDDAAGSGAPPLQDTALSPVIVPNTATTHWLKWGVCYYYLSSPEYLQFGIKYYNGSNWTVVPARTYTASVAGARDSFDVTAYNTYQRLQVYSYYDDGGGWMWYGAIDNIAINGQLYVAAHDVRTASIDVPPANVMPGTPVNPTATFGNLGNNTETFDVHYDIDSAGITIYTQTRNVTLTMGTDTTVVFTPSWTPGMTTGIVYDITVYTSLAGDTDPSNDTLHMQTTVNPTFWEILSSVFPFPSIFGHSLASAHDGTYIVFGTGPNHDSCLVYDIAANAWLGGPHMPYGHGYYGSADYVHGKYYRIGGYDDSGACTRVDIWDGASWSSGTASPAQLNDHATGVYRDSLIFTLGNGNWYSIAPSNYISFYNVYTNAWTVATSQPGVRGCNAGGVVDTFAILACGYDGSTDHNDYLVGRINPANCATITWGSWTPIPGMSDTRYRVPYGTDVDNKEFWIASGQSISVGVTAETWSYNPYTATWTNWNAPKPTPMGNVAPFAVTQTALGDIGLYICGGYANGVGVNAHEVFHTGLFGVEEKPGQPVTAGKFGFAPSMKNPVKGYSAISYTTPTSGKVMLKVYDGSGRLIRTLVNRPKEPAGTKTVYWDGKDQNNRSVSEGIYFLRLDAEGKTASQKLVVVK